MAKVVRFGPGGGAAVEESGLSVEQAKRLAAHLTAVGVPSGYCWCVGLDEGERVRWDKGDTGDRLEDDDPCRSLAEHTSESR